jgi:hypothetical protein
VHFKTIDGKLFIVPVRLSADARMPMARSFYITGSKKLRRERNKGTVVFKREDEGGAR